jgi:hypothetical protein
MARAEAGFVRRAAESIRVAILGAMLGMAPTFAAAQDEVDEEGEDWEEDDEWSEDDGADDEESDEEESEDDAEDDEDDEDDDAKRAWFFGPYFRFVMVPAFIPQLFLDEAPTIADPAIGATATWRGETVRYEFGIGYTSYAFEDPFRASGDPVDDTEWVDSSLGLVHLTGSMLWESEISQKVSFEYGFGVDFGIVTGEMIRTEAYELVPGSGEWSPCAGINNPPNIAPTGRPYCEPGPVAFDEMGAHYGVVEERVPPVALVPMVPHLALRWAPAKEIALKAEFGYGIIQLWLGVSAAYAPDI